MALVDKFSKIYCSLISSSKKVISWHWGLNDSDILRDGLSLQELGSLSNYSQQLVCL